MTRAEAIKNVVAYLSTEYETMPIDVIKALEVLKDSALAWDKLNDKLNEDLEKNKPFRQAYIKVQMMINECLQGDRAGVKNG